MKLPRLLSLTLLTSVLLFGGTYKLDNSHTNVGFKVKHMMVSNVRGDFKEFSGSFAFDEKSKTLTALEGDIKVASIDTGIEKRDNHLRSADFFDVAKYPDITFKMTKIKGDKLYGTFTMHGVTKEIELEYELGGMIEDPWGNQRVGFSLEGEINRLDYGVKWNKLIEAGGVAVSDTVKLQIEIEGILED